MGVEMTISLDWTPVIRAAVGGLKASGPRGNLLKRLALEAEGLSVSGSPDQALAGILQDKTHPAREVLLRQFAAWDFETRPAWSHTERNTRERRNEIYALLGLTDFVSLFEATIPPSINVEREIVISGADDGTWYTKEFASEREFYWPYFSDYLLRKGLDPNAIANLDETSDTILKHLAPPHSPTSLPRRGLVVGYVQSGKTTNFTAVAAKAIDAGFRLIIVLAGTIDLLRKQTQRRLDMDLVGQENINADQVGPEEDHEYRDDKAWPDKFISFGTMPREKGAPNIRRLTNSKGDFRSVKASFRSLSYDEVDPQQGRAWSAENIKRTNARLIVIKKNSSRLQQLHDEIRSAQVREDLAALIIDDESDQASVNTRDRKAATGKNLDERTKINNLIVRILRLLPRAQYIGYTATPFANVFVDVNDPGDIYPRDFIVSLPRPEGYMGVRDFHDVDPTADDKGMPNRDAHVRPFKDERADEMLRAALDDFLVSGAIKLFREARGTRIDTTHHTMLVHETVSNNRQVERKKALKSLWESANYASTSGLERLKRALDDKNTGYRLVSEARAPDLPFPSSVDELRPYLSEALDRIERDGGPVLMVNGLKDSDDPEFESKSVWKILVGGAKLSRGYTVEGLTTTYFSRSSKMADSLLQMGRWFGYRHGYKDLVRLYLYQSPDGAFDLYEAFESICRDEEAFRQQLRQYSHKLKPIHVPALVYSSYPQLLPTAKNKMINAELTLAGFEGWKESGYRKTDPNSLKRNWSLLEQLVGNDLKMSVDLSETLVCERSREHVARFLSEFDWPDGHGMHAECRFLRGDGLAGDELPVSNWVVAIPLQKERSEKLGPFAISVGERKLREPHDFGAFTGSQERARLEQFAERHKVGVLAIFPTRPKGSRTAKPVVGAAVYHPKFDGGRRIPVAFVVRNNREPQAAFLSKA